MKKFREVVLTVFVKGMSSDRKLEITACVKDSIMSVVEHIANECRIAREEHKDCALFIPTIKSKTGLFMEYEKTLEAYAIKKKVYAKLLQSYASAGYGDFQIPKAG